MTRDEIHRTYKVENGIIRSPGPYEGEPEYAPYFHVLANEGNADEYDVHNEREIPWFRIDATDVEEFPDLARVQSIRLIENDDGFVHLDVKMVR